MKTTVNSFYCNTCSIVNLLEIAAFLKVTANQLKAARAKGDTFLRGNIGTKLANWLVANKLDTVELDLTQPEAAEPDIGKAGANNKKAGRSKSTLAGGYTIVKNGARVKDNDPKAPIWDAIFSSATFEEVFAKAPPKVVRGKTIVTPASCLAWAIKSGWITVNA